MSFSACCNASSGLFQQGLYAYAFGLPCLSSGEQVGARLIKRIHLTFLGAHNK
jgi:hypothetical protein